MTEDDSAIRACGAPQRRRAETPTRKQRLERSIRPSPARFTSPPKMREKFGAWNRSVSKARQKYPYNQLPLLDTSRQFGDGVEVSIKRNEKVMTPHTGEEIIFTSSTSSGKEEIYQDDGHRRRSRRSRKTRKFAQFTKRDRASSASEDGSTEIGYEVSVKHASPTRNNIRNDAKIEKGGLVDDVKLQKDVKVVADKEDSTSGNSSVVFNFSGISHARSTELIISNDAPPLVSKDSLNSEEFRTLYKEVEKIVSRLSLSKTGTPKAANRSMEVISHQTAFRQYYFCAKTLTSVFNSGEELSFGMHAEIMKLIGALNANSTPEQKHGIAQDMYKMGIRVAPPGEVLAEDIESRAQSICNDSTVDDSENDPMNPSESIADTQSDFKDSVSQPNSGSLSSDDIDKRWEAYRAKYMNNRTPNSSDDVDDRWDRFKERALTKGIEKSASGALSMTSEIENDLIQECIDTGLPSPRMTQTWGGTARSFRREGEENSGEDVMSLQAPNGHIQSRHERDVGDSVDSKDDNSCASPPPLLNKQQRHGQPDEESDNQPFLVKRISTWEGTNDEQIARSNENDKSLDKEDPLIKEDNSVEKRILNQADDGTISSELSGDGAVNHFKSLYTSGLRTPPSSSSHSNSTSPRSRDNLEESLKMENHTIELSRIVGSNVSVSDLASYNGVTVPQFDYESNQKRTIEFLQRVSSSTTGSYSLCSRENIPTVSLETGHVLKKEPHDKSDVSQCSETYNEEVQRCPRIEETFISPLNAARVPSSEANLLIEDSQDQSLRDRNDTGRSTTEDTLEGSGNTTGCEKVGDGGQEETQETDILNTTDNVKHIQQHKLCILESSSSLTGAPDDNNRRKKSLVYKTTVETNENIQQCEQTIDLTVSCTKGKSFDASCASISSHGVPTWRLAASETLSDLDLKILTKQSNEVVNYKVHKHMLAVGPRKSELLADMFRTKSSNSVEISLDKKVAGFVPVLLDYLYCHEYSIDITTESAMALRQLGKVFKVVPLVVKVAGFILDDMKARNMSIYASDSSLFGDEAVKELVIRRCVENIQSIGVSDLLWAVIEPHLFQRILSSQILDRSTLSPHLSVLLSEYLALHQYEIDIDLFTSLTSEENIPIIDQKAALPLIELCEYYDSKECQALQKRCAHTVAFHWKTTSPEDRHRLFALLRNLPSSFTVDFLEIVEIGKLSGSAQSATSIEKGFHDADQIIDPVPSFTIGDLCDELAGEDGYSISGTSDDFLSWRSDPNHSFSDWTIRVKHLNHKRGDVYHVHKQIISLGPRRSEFFSQLFIDMDFRASVRGVTTVELDHKAALAFPDVLDFIYIPDHKLDFTQERAIVLRFLARVLGVSLLNRYALEFMGKDMCLVNVIQYIQGAYMFEDEKVLAIASRLCASEIQNIDMDSQLLEEFKPDFFAKLVASSEIRDSSKCHLTILITKYFSLHNLDEDILAELLKHVQVPRIDCVSAVKLLKILSKLEKSQEIDIFDKLQRRCANILTENWNDLRDNHRDEVFSIFPSLHPALLTEIFDVVDHQYMVQHYESMSLQSRLVKRYRSQLAEVNHLREQEVSLLRKELEDRTIDMLSVQQELEKKLGLVNVSLNRRTGRSAAAYGIQVRTTSPSSPVQMRVVPTRESRIPRLRTQSPSTLTVESKASRLAKNEKNAGSPCCLYSSPTVQDRDDCSEAETVAESYCQRESTQMTPDFKEKHQGLIQPQNHQHDLEIDDPDESSTTIQTGGTYGGQKSLMDDNSFSKLPWSSEEAAGEDAELSA